MLDGTERAGVLRVVLGAGVADDELPRHDVGSLSGLLGHIVMAELPTATMQSTAPALTAIRNARRAGETDLAVLVSVAPPGIPRSPDRCDGGTGQRRPRRRSPAAPGR